MLNNCIYRYVKVNRHQGHYGQFLANSQFHGCSTKQLLVFSQFSSDSSFFRKKFLWDLVHGLLSVDPSQQQTRVIANLKAQALDLSRIPRSIRMRLSRRTTIQPSDYFLDRVLWTAWQTCTVWRLGNLVLPLAARIV
jgi:hypothetical protein